MGYLVKILRYFREDPELRDIGIGEIEIRHDAWCSLLAGTGFCDCNPDIGGVSTIELSEED